MSIIAVEGLNLQISLVQVSKMLSKCIRGHFEPLHFVNSDRSLVKTCYLQLSDKLDPVEVIERINNVAHGKKKNVLNAYIPDKVPNLPVAPLKMRKQLGVVPEEDTTTHAISTAQNELLMELQYKYTGLYNLSSKGSHTLLEAIAMTIRERLQKLVLTDEESANPFVLTARYHKVHPHSGDFQLIVSTLHRLQDAAGAPRTPLTEAELIDVPKDINVVDNIPYTKAQEAISKYTEKIMKKLEEHVGSYDLSENPEDSPEDAARKKVQTQISKMMPYMPTIMNQVVVNHFVEDNKKYRFHKMRMYGSPHLPGKELTTALLKKLGALRVSRWKAAHNLLVFDLPLHNYVRAVQLDNTTVGGCKLTIRSSNVNIYRVRSKRAEHTDMDDEDADIAMDQC